MPAPSPAGAPAAASLTRYVAGWAAAGLAALVATSVHEPAAITLATLGWVTLVAVAELVEIRLPVGRTRTSFTLLEAAVVASVFTLPPSEALLVTVGGVTFAQVARRRPPLKLVFNSAQVALATTAALATLAMLPVRSALSDPLVTLSASAATLVYAAVTLAAATGVLHRLTGRTRRALLVEHGPQVTLTILGNGAVGLLATVIAASHPHLLPLVAAPVVTTYLSSQGSVRTRGLLARLAGEHERLDRVVEQAGDGIVLLDADGRVEVWNDAMHRMTGIPRTQAVGARTHDLTVNGLPFVDVIAPPPDDLDGVEAAFHREDGSTVVVSASHRLLRTSTGEFDGDVVVVRDVTKQRQVEALKGDFIARVSHELRTPLTPIKGMAQTLLASESRVTADQRRVALEQIIERSDHMGRIVDDLLTVSRIGADAAGSHAEHVAPVPTELAPLVQRAVAWTRAEQPARTVTLRMPDRLPDTIVDPLRTAQVLTNLLSNAAKYSDVAAPIDVEVTVAHDVVGVEVSDRGQGIPADRREEIFEAFSRLEDPLTMRTGGLGLGLFLARRFARAMGGDLGVQARPGGGSTFRLTLPRVERPASPSRADTAPGNDRSPHHLSRRAMRPDAA